MIGYKHRTRINHEAMSQQSHRFCGRLVRISQRCHCPRSPSAVFSQASMDDPRWRSEPCSQQFLMAEVEDWAHFCSGYEPARGSTIAVRKHGAIGSRTSFPEKVVYEQGRLVYTVASMSIGPQALEKMVKDRTVKLRRGFWPAFFKNTLKRQHT